MDRIAMLAHLVVCLSLIGVVYSTCHLILPEVTMGPGGPSATCTYNNVKYPAGAKFLTYDCMNCTFTANYCLCCGYGYKAGPMHVPDHCKRKLIGCYAIYVRKDDESRLCT